MEFEVCAKADFEFKDMTREEVGHFLYILIKAKDADLSEEEAIFCEKITKCIGQVANKFSRE